MDPQNFNGPTGSPTPPKNQPIPEPLGRQVNPVNWSETPRPSKRLLIVGTVGVGAVLLLAGGSWVWASNAKSQYIKASSAYEAKAKDANDYFLKLQDRLTHGSDIQKKFDQTIASAPKEPKLLGVSLAPADKVKRVNNLTNAMKKFENSYVKAANVSAYSEKTLTTMAKVTGTINSPDSMKFTRTKLEETKKTLAAVQPPTPAKDFHASILASYQTVIDDINNALAALEKGDTTAYTSYVENLAADVRRLSPNSARDELEIVFNAAYGKADAAYGELQTLLGVK